MEKLSPEQLQILLQIHQSQHDESLAHRNAIFLAFSLSFTGLMVLAGAVITLHNIPTNLKWLVVIAVGVVCACIIFYISNQRQKSELAIKTNRAIETQLDLFEKGKYFPGEPVLPPEYANSQSMFLGFSQLDWLLVLPPIVALAIVIIIVTLQLPAAP